jgi:Uma2 family endonuclease
MEPLAPTETTEPKLTYEDYCRIPEDGQRHEILDGVHVVSPAPRKKHQRLLGNLFFVLERHLRVQGDGEVYLAPFDVLLSEYDILQPDLVFVSDERLHLLDELNCKGSPDLVVEILSPSTARRDQVDKRARYEAHEVREYWIVDPESEVLRMYRRDAKGGLELHCELQRDRGGALETPLLPGFSVPIEEVFRD